MSRKKTYLDSGVLITAFQGIQSTSIQALQIKADELITTEKPTKPIHRVREILIISI